MGLGTQASLPFWVDFTSLFCSLLPQALQTSYRPKKTLGLLCRQPASAAALNPKLHLWSGVPWVSEGLLHPQIRVEWVTYPTVPRGMQMSCCIWLPKL